MNGEESMDPNQMKQLEEMKNKLLGKILHRDAQERLGRVRIADPQLASQVELYLIQLFQAGKLQELVTDEKLKEVLRILSEKKEISIRRR